MPKTSLFAFLLFAACGGSGDDSKPDAPAGESFTITVQTDTPPALLALRDGPDAPWQAVPIAGGTYELAAHGPYTVALVCDFPSTEFPGVIDIEQYQRTPDDDRTIASTCKPQNANDGNVTGHMVQAGRVSVAFGFGEQSAVPAWDFDIPVASGAHQLVAVGDARIVRRELNVLGATPTETIDVAKDGTALVPVALRVTNATPAEAVRASVTLLTRDLTFAQISSGELAAAKLIPDALLTGDDHQRVRITATVGNNLRSVSRRDVTAAPLGDLALPEGLGPVQYGVANNTLTATWSTLPAHDDLNAELDSISEALQKSIFYFISASNRYTEATHATSVTFATDFPGFDPRWAVDLGTRYVRTVTTLAHAGADTRSSSVFEEVNAPQPRALPSNEWQRTAAGRKVDRLRVVEP